MRQLGGLRRMRTDESTLDEVLEKLKKRRLLLKDDIAALIASERGGN